MSSENFSKEQIIVVGFGWVGQANALALVRMGYDVSFFDVVSPKHHYSDEFYALYEKIKALPTLLAIDSPKTYYIVCIGDRVSEDNFQDISLIKNVLQSLRGATGKVILRSTVLPDYLKDLPFDFYVPEFLHEIYAVEECLNPYYFVLGLRGAGDLPEFLQTWEKRARKVFRGTPEQASYIKYLSNIWNAVRIAFVNEFGDSMALPVTEAQRAENERVIDFILERKSYVRYGRAFGGHCLPKDMRAYIGMVAGRHPVSLLKGVYAANTHHRDIEEKYKTLQQVFSVWDYSSYQLAAVTIPMVILNRLTTNRVALALRHFFKPLVFKIENFLPNKSLDHLKRMWNESAVTNPYYFTNPDTRSGKNADEFETKETGKQDFNTYFIEDDLLAQIRATAASASMLDIGSGIGRTTEYFATIFKEVFVLDIAEEMISSAKKRLAFLDNIQYLVGSGNNISVPDNSIDFIFSQNVFKHLPGSVLIEDYLKEIKRTLKIDGIAKIQFRTGAPVHRWQWFYGLSISPSEARMMAERLGLKVLKIEADSPKSLWLWLRKSAN